ncbi:MAG: urea ABC transporter permease subunit UrtC [Chloroflexi bacterium]|nr:urea ABC transporter permease subunit UrtC [Chloroflexota bacterium]
MLRLSVCPVTTITRSGGARAADRLEIAALVAAAVLLLIVAPALLSPFRLNLLGKFLAYAIAALGLDLLWGYTGLLSLGQAVFFGLGAYSVGMYLKLEASGGKLPDFMEWSGLSALPTFWYPFASPWFAFGMAIVGPGLLAALIGYLLFRNQIGGVSFAIITQALAVIFSTLFIGQQPYIGGTNGLTNFSTLLGWPLADQTTQVHLYQATVLGLLLSLLLARWIVRSDFGRLLLAIRDAEERARVSGYDPAWPKLVVFVVSAALAGLAGALYVPQVGIVNPDALGVTLSMSMVIWVAVGGRGSLLGAVLGALFVNAAQSALSETFPNVWQYAVGGLFIATVLVFPGGGLGLARWSGSRMAGRIAGLRSPTSPKAEPVAVSDGPVEVPEGSS